jgi:hypothetical protein
MQYFYLILFVSGALLLLSIMYFISCKNLISSVTLSLLVLLLVVVLGWWICSNFVHKYALEEACETISELKDEDKKKLVEDIVSHNKFLDCFAFGLARVDTNKYPDLFSVRKPTLMRTEASMIINMALLFLIIIDMALVFRLIIIMIYLVSDLIFSIFCQ